MIHIDGSAGEGGGQILRTSLSLSMITGKPVRIEKIRAGRRKPGLMRQHLTAVSAAAAVSGAEIKGAETGSAFIEFRPGTIKSGHYRFAVGTAGSATLVFQTVLPALLMAGGSSILELEGGTHNPFAPTFDFLEKVFLPVLVKMGGKVGVSLERHGFYPAGGGKFTASIEPSRPRVIELLERGEVEHRLVIAKVAKIPGNVGDRELDVFRKKLGWSDDVLETRGIPDSTGPGNVVSAEIGGPGFFEVFTGFGEKGIAAEKVADQAVNAVREFLSNDAPVGKHLADQILIPMVMAGGGRFRTSGLSRHTLTNIEVIRNFTDIPITVRETGKENVEIGIGSCSHSTQEEKE